MINDSSLDATSFVTSKTTILNCSLIARPRYPNLAWKDMRRVEFKISLSNPHFGFDAVEQSIRT